MYWATQQILSTDTAAIWSEWTGGHAGFGRGATDNKACGKTDPSGEELGL